MHDRALHDGALQERTMRAQEGWLLDVYADPQDGLVVWFLGDDGARLRLRRSFPVTFYAAGPAVELRGLWRYLESQPVSVRLERTERRDLFVGKDIPVLAAEVAQPAAQPELFRQASRRFPDLTYYDADLVLALRYAAQTGAFPLARCRVTTDGGTRLEQIQVLDTPWVLDPAPAPLRILAIDPDVNPSHAAPRRLALHYQGNTVELSMQPERALLINLRAILHEYDPDLLLTTWGDTWLLPELVRLARKWRFALPFNRDAGRGLARRAEKSYFSYGQVIHRGQQIHLFGRWHIDRCNAMLWGDYGLDGVLELARVTSLPVQTSARVSPGTGISSMQILTALRQGVLVPWHKQQAEDPRRARDLLYAAQGGLVYQPLIGLHRDVAEVDFISMYPSVMVHFNISPETVGAQRANAREIPELGLAIDVDHPGLVPQTLEPLLKKRIALKAQIASLPPWDPRRRRYKVYASAHKWLLVTCFGYLGYKNARFGRIEAHQAVTAYGREMLLRAKEAAEALGFTVLHLYVDGMWVKKPGARRVADFQPLLDHIAEETGLPISLDGIYRWLAFLPSRRNERIPVANRYFGAFQDGSLKMRGIDARRQDTPPFIAKAQIDILEMFARAQDADELPDMLPAAVARLRGALAELRLGRLALADCLVTQKLSRTLDEYRAPSPAARAVAQLQEVGKRLRPGQRVRFLYLRGEPGVQAWDLPDPPATAALDYVRYL
ncbi:MAG: hypothetical protein M1281_00330, partial [Chloroflexi bacterium]|nr:hypothetical protein [Chloroflexota bacterium]